jgi:hypothetical protein
MRAQPVGKRRKHNGISLQLVFNAMRGFGSLAVHGSRHGTADSAEE